MVAAVRYGRSSPGAAGLLFAIAVSVLSSGVAGQPSVSLYYVASTVVGPTQTSPATGINSGHNVDPSWLTWMQHLGVTGVRIFGLAGAIRYIHVSWVFRRSSWPLRALK